MNPKQFLQFGGAILVVLGVVGLLPVFTKANTPWFYLDAGENIAHIGLGVVAIAAAYLLTDPVMQKWLVAVVGVVALFFGVYGFVVMGQPEPNTFGLANLESPADNLLHLVVGAWALYAAFMGRTSMSTA
ncbi:MAG TPA: DUF4383 domain-containing protein [Candidatus Limnocylindria bacterium]|jgi:hypothetical protein|nr:DUF4383 domain-containing protein [Candidatus Limnocylindria bacterium]